MAIDRKPCIASERFLQPIFDASGALQTARLVEAGNEVNLADDEVVALEGKARPVTPRDPPAGRP